MWGLPAVCYERCQIEVGGQDERVGAGWGWVDVWAWVVIVCRVQEHLTGALDSVHVIVLHLCTKREVRLIDTQEMLCIELVVISCAACCF